MGRGKAFHHQTKGQNRELPKSAIEVAPKHADHVEYAIEPVASADRDAVSFQIVKETEE
ncbi:hypothetical protein [Bacillus suaedaesalsae]|uniref:Uncharacterized protein n=1 Tax=Bacillus suaedaesalsae TaxID=2810349 RepID=A0ABS2DN15_9BACI|nr:hypothetical protein [Bacillus suaedaesalsae]MBM6619816.1 hypothetical protein [Bacillus suaedaesalsae]